jgi:hypothetical protein
MIKDQIFFKGQIWSPKAKIFKLYDFFTDLGYFAVNYSGKVIGLSKKAIKAAKRRTMSSYFQILSIARESVKSYFQVFLQRSLDMIIVCTSTYVLNFYPLKSSFRILILFLESKFSFSAYNSHFFCNDLVL